MMLSPYFFGTSLIKICAILAVFLISSVCLAQVSFKETIVFDWIEHDFGETEIGSSKSVDLLLTNVSKKTIIIKSILSGCNCTTIKAPKRVIAPETQILLSIDYNSIGRKPGKITQQIVFYFSDLDNPIVITIKATLINKSSP